MSCPGSTRFTWVSSHPSPPPCVHGARTVRCGRHLCCCSTRLPPRGSSARIRDSGQAQLCDWWGQKPKDNGGPFFKTYGEFQDGAGGQETRARSGQAHVGPAGSGGVAEAGRTGALKLGCLSPRVGDDTAPASGVPAAANRLLEALGAKEGAVPSPKRVWFKSPFSPGGT